MDQSKLLQVAYQDREAFEQLKKYQLDGAFHGPAKLLWDAIDEYYGKDQHAAQCDGEVLVGRIGRKNEKAGQAAELIISHFNPELSVPNLTQEILEAKRYAIGLDLASLLTSPMAKPNEVSELIDQYTELSLGVLGEEEETGSPDIFTSDDLDDLTTVYEKDNLVPIYPLSLNEHLDGGVPPQTSIAVFARPEYGKSMVGINMAYGTAKNGFRTMYLGNEDPHTEMRLRLMSRFTGMRKLELIRNLEDARQIAMDKGFDNLIFGSLYPGTIREIVQLIEKYRPQVIFIDQLRNLEVGDDNLVVKLERAAKMVRDIGKKYNLVTVQITQAGDSATNKLVLDYTDVDSSKTGFPAAFDVMVGVGANEAYKETNKRMLSLCKNKINNNHEYFSVNVDPTLSKVISL